MILSTYAPSENAAPPAAAPPAKLYQRVKADPERMAGTQVRYDSFADFITTAKAEAKDPSVVGAADILDIINPLQHIPVIGQIYRGVTGDTIKPASNMIGGALFGGGIGLAGASIGEAVREETGGEIGQALLGQALAPTENRNAISALKIEPTPVCQSHAASLYRDIQEKTSPADPEAPRRVVMTDPERTAGSFVRYG